MTASDTLNLIRTSPTYGNHVAAFEDLRKTDPASLGARTHLRVAVVANFTAEPLMRCLWAQLYARGAWMDGHLTPSGEYVQEVVGADSEFYRFEPDVTLVMLTPAAVLPAIFGPAAKASGATREQVDTAIRSYLAMLDVLRSRVSGTVFVANLAAHEASPFGPLDWQLEVGSDRAVHYANQALADWARSQERTFVFDLAGLSSATGRERVFDERMRLVADQPFATSFLPTLAAAVARYVSAITGPARKCLVLDLDNTLWGGILAEDGQASLRIGGDAVGEAHRQFQRAALDLHDRGILLALCSRNDRDEAMAVLRDHPDMLIRPQHIAASRIGFSDKVEGLRAIADELNIGLDSLVFLDDDQFERQNVRERLPDVLVPDLPKDPAFYRRALLELDAFDMLRITAEDRARGQLYQERRDRDRLQEQASSLEDYLAGLQMEVTIVPAEGAARTRLFQLVHKTNRFNLTTRRYTENEFDARIASSDYGVFGVHVKDRLGDSGIVGLVVVHFHDDVCDIETFLLSCRVMGRQIETAILAYVADLARSRKAARLVGRYLPTAKNGNVRDLYEKHGFSLEEPQGEAEVWGASLDRVELRPPVWANARL